MKSKNLIEYVSTGISVLIVSSLVGLLTYDHFTRGNSPAEIKVTMKDDQIEKRNNKYYLPVEVTNTGDQTAEEVMVEITLEIDSKIETSELTFHFVDSDEIEESEVIWNDDPRNGKLEVDEISYLKPS